MRRFAIVVAALVALSSAACQFPQAKPRSQAYIVDSQGTVSAGTRSALDGTPAPGRQELIALYIPPMPGLPGSPDFRAGVTVDPSFTLPIVIAPPLATQAAPAPYAAPTGCATTQTVMVQEAYQETTMVPQTVTKYRTVPRTVTVPGVTLPLPQAAPVKGPCDPTPPPSPAVSALDVPKGDVCTDEKSCATASAR